MAKQKSRRCEQLPVLHPDAAGIDVGASELFVAVSADRDPSLFAVSPLLPVTYMPWPTGCNDAGSAQLRWNLRACTGYPYTKSWKTAASKSIWSTRGT